MKIEVEKMTRVIGAELTGVSLRDAAHNPDIFAELKALLLQHRVLFLRDQDITRADHIAFARRFGELEDHPFVGNDPEYPEMLQLHRGEEKDTYENHWHVDGIWRENPAMVGILRCTECPADGGDTIWANMVEAYTQLPDDIKDRIAVLRARSSIEHAFGAAMSIDERRALDFTHPPAEHPVVRTHPETGEKILFVSSFTTHFVNYHTPRHVRVGLDKNPGASLLLNYLQSQAMVPEYQVRFRWRPNSVAIWDNRSTQHYAVKDYWPDPRKMDQTVIVGDRPF